MLTEELKALDMDSLELIQKSLDENDATWADIQSALEQMNIIRLGHQPSSFANRMRELLKSHNLR